MDDFEAALQARLAANAEIAERHRQAEAEMDKAKADKAEAEARAAAERAQAQRDRHGELVEHLKAVAAQLKASDPEGFIVRLGWTPSGEEFIARISTRQTEPARTLFIELDRDDDEVLARWTGDLGSAIELWRLLEVTPAMLSKLVLDAADQTLWRGARKPPPFPAASG